MCIFCKIVKQEIPSKIAYQNDQFLAFYDISPKAPIHILIIPKEHVDSFCDLSSDLMAAMTLFIQEMVKKLDIADDGYRLITNIGSDGGQEVKHMHFHLLAGAKLKWGGFV